MRVAIEIFERHFGKCYLEAAHDVIWLTASYEQQNQMRERIITNREGLEDAGISSDELSFEDEDDGLCPSSYQRAEPLTSDDLQALQDAGWFWGNEEECWTHFC